MKKILYTALILFAATSMVAAQTTEEVKSITKHEFSVSAFGGLQSLQYDVENGSVSSSFGGGGGIGYFFNFNSKWSIGTGVDFAYYASSYEIPTMNGTYKNNGITFNYTVTGYEETQSALMLEIPVLARFSLGLGESQKSAMQFTAGVKFGFPMSASFTASAAGHKTNTAKDEYVGVDFNFDEILAPNSPQAVAKQSGDFDASMSIQALAEIGYRMPIGEKNGLYFGAYFTYGLNDMQKTTDGELITYSTTNQDLTNNPPQYFYNGSILNTKDASSIRPMGFGLKMRFSFGL